MNQDVKRLSFAQTAQIKSVLQPQAEVRRIHARRSNAMSCLHVVELCAIAAVHGDEGKDWHFDFHTDHSNIATR